MQPLVVEDASILTADCCIKNMPQFFPLQIPLIIRPACKIQQSNQSDQGTVGDRCQQLCNTRPSVKDHRDRRTSTSTTLLSRCRPVLFASKLSWSRSTPNRSGQTRARICTQPVIGKLQLQTPGYNIGHTQDQPPCSPDRVSQPTSGAAQGLPEGNEQLVDSAANC